MFEIVAFENQTLYDLEVVDDAISEYIATCANYINPKYVLEEEVSITHGRMFISYSQRGGDKAMNVLLLGPLTPEMIYTINEALKNLYIRKCEACGASVNLKRVLCVECANYN